MALSKNIVSQFVKTTKKDKETSKETIVYGRVASYNQENNTCMVILDGATKKSDGTYNETLVTQLTSMVNVGQVVTVMIKNHSAVITGNIGDPAIGTSYAGEIMGSISAISSETIESLWEI